MVTLYRFEEDKLFSFENDYVEVEELVVFNMANEDGIQILNYDSYVPRFSVLIDGYGNVIDH